MSDPSVWTPGGDSAVVQLVVAALTSQSSSTVAVSAGTKNFTVGIQKLFLVGSWLLAVDNSNSSNFMLGQVVSYDNNLGLLVLTVPSTAWNGTGSPTSWTVTVSGLQGVSGTLSGSISGNIEFLGNILIDGTLGVGGVLNLAADPTSALQAATKQYIDALIPIGTILDWTTASVPNSKWILGQGQAISRTTYATLFGLWSTTYGTGDGATTFNVPDFRRRVRVGLGGTGTGTLAATIGSTGGEENHTLTVAEIASHQHSVPLSAWNGHAGSPGSDTPLYTGANTAVTNAQGGGGAHNNIQPSIVMTAIIRAL